MWQAARLFLGAARPQFRWFVITPLPNKKPAGRLPLFSSGFQEMPLICEGGDAASSGRLLQVQRKIRGLRAGGTEFTREAFLRNL